LYGDDMSAKPAAALAIVSMMVATLLIAPPASGDPTVKQLSLVNEARVGRTIFDLTYRVTFQNDAVARSAVSATLKGAGQGTSIIDGVSVLGDLAPSASVTPTDTITVRHNRQYPFNPSALVFEYTASVPDVGRIVAVPPLPPLPVDAIALLPTNPSTGRPIAQSSQGYNLELDIGRKDRITGLGACTSLIANCVKPGERTLDDCARSAPVCKTATPWEEAACCPAACYAAYKTSRAGGLSDIHAFESSYYGGKLCFPK
jgi:hypothetical protein